MSKISTKKELKQGQVYWIKNCNDMVVPCHYLDNDAHNGYISKGIAYTTREEAVNHKELSAKEIFEELGYKQIDDNHPYFIILENIEDNQQLVFNTMFKKIFIHTFNANDDNVRSVISIKLHLAIHQQMKELGWIE